MFLGTENYKRVKIYVYMQFKIAYKGCLNMDQTRLHKLSRNIETDKKTFTFFIYLCIHLCREIYGFA